MDITNTAATVTLTLQQRADAIIAECGPAQPFAVFAYEQPGFEELPPLMIYTVYGGAYDHSSVSAETLRELGIEVPR